MEGLTGTQINSAMDADTEILTRWSTNAAEPSCWIGRRSRIYCWNYDLGPKKLRALPYGKVKTWPARKNQIEISAKSRLHRLLFSRGLLWGWMILGRNYEPRCNIWKASRNHFQISKNDRDIAVHITFGQKACATIYWGWPFRFHTLYLTLQTMSNQVFVSTPSHYTLLIFTVR